MHEPIRSFNTITYSKHKSAEKMFNCTMSLEEVSSSSVMATARLNVPETPAAPIVTFFPASTCTCTISNSIVMALFKHRQKQAKEHNMLDKKHRIVKRFVQYVYEWLYYHS